MTALVLRDIVMIWSIKTHIYWVYIILIFVGEGLNTVTGIIASQELIEALDLLVCNSLWASAQIGDTSIDLKEAQTQDAIDPKYINTYDTNT